MAGRAGFFTRTDLKKPSKSIRGKMDVPVEYMHKLGLAGFNDAPLLLPEGKCSDVYVLVGAPTPRDMSSEQLLSDHRGLLVENILGATRVAAVCPALPDGTEPTRFQIECARPSLEADINKHAPRVVVALGRHAIRWCLPTTKQSAEMLNERLVPARIGGHVCWVVCAYDPEYVLSVADKGRAGMNNAPGKDIRRHFNNALTLAHTTALHAPAPEDPDKVRQALRECWHPHTNPGALLHEFEQAVADAEKQGFAAFDLETSGLRPYDGGKILSVAVASATSAAALPVDHPQCKWSPKQRKRVQRLLKRLLGIEHLIAHNAMFDVEWLTYYLGPQVLHPDKRYECTMSGAFVLDERRGGHGLDFLCLQAFGVSIKSLSGGSWESATLKHLLYYNAIDAAATLMLYEHQSDLFAQEDPCVEDAYWEHVQRIPSLVHAQYLGLDVDQAQVKRLKAQTQALIDDAQRRIQSNKHVQEYTKIERVPFNPLSPEQVVELVRDYMRRDDIVKADGSVSVDKTTLAQLHDPLADAILELREASKLMSTYIDPHLPHTEGSVIRADGRVHTQYKHLATGTGRTASQDPNAQNYPKRSNKHIRRMIIPPAGHRFVAVDYGQLEARVIAMASEDEVLVRSIWDGYDIHLEWAGIIADAAPHVLERHKGDMKSLRSEVKNGMVFPAFYGASTAKIARQLGMNERTAKPVFARFWDTFQGVAAWQKRLLADYQRNFYVQCLTGRRRRGPLSRNMVINSPIQGSASDIVVDAMHRCRELAWRRDELFYAPVLNIHDDLTFAVPEDRQDEAVQRIVDVMLDCPYEWARIVPLAVEVEAGPNWADLEAVGTYSSDSWEWLND